MRDCGCFAALQISKQFPIFFQIRLMELMNHFDVAFVHPTVLRNFPDVKQKVQAASSKIIVAPTPYFDGYHPDLCFVTSDAKRINSPIGDYHSGLCLGAFQAGLTVYDAIALFNDTTYDRLGYYDVWTQSRDLMIKGFANHGHDIGADFLRWTRNGPFLYSVNHPRIQCLFDLAKKFLAAAEIAQIAPPFPPVDTLSKGSWFPVYPGIAERCGVESSTVFKLKQQDIFFNLEEFVSRSFEIYKTHKCTALQNAFADRPRFAALTEFLGGPTA